MSRSGPSLIAALAAALLACEMPQDPPSRPSASAPAESAVPGCLTFPPAIDFGEVELHRSVARAFVINNTYNAAAALTVGSVPPPFLTPRTRFTVAARGSVSITFSVTATDSRALTGVVRFTQGPTCPVVDVPIIARGAGEVIFNTRALDFPPAPIGTTTELELTLVNTRRVPVELTLSYSRSVGNVAVGMLEVPSNVMLAPAEAARLPLRFTGTRDGAEAGFISVAFSVPQAFPGLSVLAVAGVPRAEVSRTRISLAHVPSNLSATRRVFLRNTAGGMLLTDAQLLSEDGGLGGFVLASTHAGRVPAGSSVPLDFVLRPFELGDRAATLRITTNDPSTPVLTVAVTAHFENVAPCSYPVEATLPPVAPPYPAAVPVSFSNRSARGCLVEALGPSEDVPLTTDLGDDDSFVVPANQAVTRVLTIPDAGRYPFKWTTYSTLPLEAVIDAP